MRSPFLCLASLLVASAAGAQQRRASTFETARPARLHPTVLSRPDTLPAESDSLRRRHDATRGAERSLAAAGGWLVGGLAGGAITSASLGEPDAEGLEIFVVVGGVLVGGTVGAALGSGLPAQPGGCSYSRRAGNGLLGAIAGDALGILIANHVDERVGVYMLPVFSSLGAGILSHCPRRPVRLHGRGVDL